MPEINIILNSLDNCPTVTIQYNRVLDFDRAVVPLKTDCHRRPLIATAFLDHTSTNMETTVSTADSMAAGDRTIQVSNLHPDIRSIDLLDHQCTYDDAPLNPDRTSLDTAQGVPNWTIEHKDRGYTVVAWSQDLKHTKLLLLQVMSYVKACSF